MSAQSLALLGVLLWAVWRAVYLINKIKDVRGLPRYICLFEPISPWFMLLPMSSWNPTIKRAWYHKEDYQTYQAEAIHFIPLLGGEPTIQCGSPEVVKQMLNDIKAFPKPEKALALKFMGDNVVSTNGQDWRRHRKVTSPAFDNRVYMDVWRVTSDLYKQMMDSPEWKSGDEHFFENFVPFTTRLALLVIAACGFNMVVPWDGSFTRDDLKNDVDTTIVQVCRSLVLRLVIPRWMYKLPIQGLKKIDFTFNELERFMDAEITAKQEELAQEAQSDKKGRNLFARVVLASQEEGASGAGLTHDEIRGNLFIYLFAGHETTAHTLVATLALLATHQGEQRRVYEVIRGVLGDREPVYEDYNALTPVLHCFYEALRLYPAATNLMRAPISDATITAPSLTADSDTIFVAKGTSITIDMIGVSYNARNYPDPYKFNPRRWAADPSSEKSTSEFDSADPEASLDNFLAFSAGPRVCLGKKFSTVEATCFLSNILRDWKFDIKLEGGETVREWQERVMTPEIGVTLRLDRIPLMVTRRKI